MSDRPDPADYDDAEPYVLEDLRIGPAELADLAGMPLAATNCEFVGCDLSLVSFHGVKHSSFSSSKLRGTRFTKHLTSVTFNNTQLTECRFRMMLFKQVTLTECQLVDCDFYGSELHAVSFPKSSIQGVGFDACTLHDVDLSQASDLLIGDPRTLTASTISEAQVHLIALRLAQLSGINIAES